MPSGLGHAARLAEISGSEFFAAYSDGRNKSVTYAFVGFPTEVCESAGVGRAADCKKRFSITADTPSAFVNVPGEVKFRELDRVDGH
jgi:hypothetical protein